jgi:flagellar M-ring protein FliF
MGLLQAVARQLGQIWTHLSAGHKLILVLLFLACGGAMVGVVYWAGSPDYEILYTGLAATECAEMVKSLKAAGIPVRVTEGGGAVMVPAQRVYEARMVAAEKGIPTGARGGFDTFNNPKIGITPFAERINYISALQNELATTIMSLDSVTYARVHLVTPEPSLFKKDERKPTASVLIITRNGQQLDVGQIAGISNLVASAVEGLSPKDVTITDAKGNVLAGSGQDAAEMAAGDQFAYRQRIETYLSNKADTMLAKVLGNGRCEVRVSAELTFEDTRETRKEYDPDKSVKTSERIESSKASGKGTQVGGVVGTAANMPGANQQSPETAAGPTQDSKSDTIDTRYVVSESVRETVNRGATIKRLSVAAVVDLTAPTAAESPSGEGGTAKASPAGIPDINAITKIIKDAIGFNAERGDSLEIVEATFPPGPTEVPASNAAAMPQWLPFAAEYAAIAVVCIVLLLVGRHLAKGIKAATPSQVLVPEIMNGQSNGAYPPQAVRAELMQQEVTRFVQDNPEAATRLLEGWIKKGG